MHIITQPYKSRGILFLRGHPVFGKVSQPEITSFPSIDAIRRNADFKIETVMELIQKDKQEKKN